MQSRHQMNTYKPAPVAFSHGQGAWLYTVDGRKVLDALAGIAVSGLGHAHPKLTKAIVDQAGKLIHTSNLVNIPEQAALADKLCSLAEMDNVFFGNSGAEANECAIKLARFYGHQRGIAVDRGLDGLCEGCAGISAGGQCQRARSLAVE